VAQKESLVTDTVEVPEYPPVAAMAVAQSETDSETSESSSKKRKHDSIQNVEDRNDSSEDDRKPAAKEQDGYGSSDDNQKKPAAKEQPDGLFNDDSEEEEVGSSSDDKSSDDNQMEPAAKVQVNGGDDDNSKEEEVGSSSDDNSSDDNQKEPAAKVHRNFGSYDNSEEEEVGGGEIDEDLSKEDDSNQDDDDGTNKNDSDMDSSTQTVEAQLVHTDVNRHISHQRIAFIFDVVKDEFRKCFEPKAEKNLLSRTLDTYNGKKTPQELPQIVADNLMKGTIDASGINNFKELCKKETGDPDEVLSYVFYKSSVTGKWQRSGVLRDDLQALLRLQSIHKRLLCQYCHLVKNFIDAHYENVEQLIDVYDCSFFLEYYLSIDERPIELGIDKHRELTKRNILGKQDVIIVMSDTSATHFFTVVYQPERKKLFYAIHGTILITTC